MGDMTREPSMEEILSSIRRVIARDDRAAARGDTMAPADVEAGEIDAPDDVLELTQHSAGAIGNDEGESEGEPPAFRDVTATDTLLSDVSEQASRQSIAALTDALNHSAEPAGEPITAAGGDITLNAMVEGMLRPMLRQWLDSNLPPLVERLVAREIARITGNRF